MPSGWNCHPTFLEEYIFNILKILIKFTVMHAAWHDFWRKLFKILTVIFIWSPIREINLKNLIKKQVYVSESCASPPSLWMNDDFHQNINVSIFKMDMVKTVQIHQVWLASRRNSQDVSITPSFNLKWFKMFINQNQVICVSVTEQSVIEALL